MRQHPELGFAAIGYLEAEGNRFRPGVEVARLGSVANMAALIDTHRPDWIVFSQRSTIRPGWVDELLELRFGGVEAADAAGLYETTLGRVCASEIRPSDLVFSQTLQPKRLAQNLQSLLATGVAALALLVTAPLFAIFAILIKATSRGPVLLREKRIWLRGAPFTLYRFRTHYVDARTERPPPIGPLR